MSTVGTHVRPLCASCTQVRFVSDTLARSEGGRGPKQQLIHALVECLSQLMSKFPVGDPRLMTSFEELLLTEPNCAWSVAAVSCTLGMSGRLMRQSCQACVRMRPQSILRQLRERLGGWTAAWLPPPEWPRSCLSNTVRRAAVTYFVARPLWRASAIDGVRRNYCSVTEFTWRAVDLWIVGVQDGDHIRPSIETRGRIATRRDLRALRWRS